MAIHNWPPSEQPRERLLTQGPEALSDAELLAILLNNGLKGLSALDLARLILTHFNGLGGLLSCDLDSFTLCPGLTTKRYAQLRAALEMSHRYCFEQLRSLPLLDNTRATHRFLLGKLRNQPREIFACLLLDQHHHMLSYQEIFHGSQNEAKIYPREIIKLALAENASSIILVHNHPSGNCQPSHADRELTKELLQALAYVNIAVLDHIIIGNGQVFSFCEQGLL